MAKLGGNLQLIAAKSGLGDEDKVLRKAEEYQRRLKMKSSMSSNISDLAKSVFCLDLAATTLGVDYDIKSLIKSSGLKPSQYSNSKKVVENLLELSCNSLTVPLLCAQLHCDTAQEVANKVLDQMQKSTKVEMDLNLPQYICMAVYQACRVNKIKISKSKFVEKSRLKPGQWSKMEGVWTKIVDQHFAVAKKKGSKTTQVVNDELSEKMEVDKPIPKQDDEMNPPVEPYEVWKRRILTAAYAALAKEESADSQVNDKHTSLAKEKRDVTRDKNNRKSVANNDNDIQLNDNGQHNEKSGHGNIKNRQEKNIKKRQETEKRILFYDNDDDKNDQDCVKSPQKRVALEENIKKRQETEKRILFDDNDDDKNDQDCVKSPKKRVALEFNRNNIQVNDDRRQSPRKHKVNGCQVNESPARRQVKDKVADSPKNLTRKQQVTDSPRQITRKQLNNNKQTEIADNLNEHMTKTVDSPMKMKTYKNKNKIVDVEMKDAVKPEKSIANAVSSCRSDEKNPVILLNDIFNLSPRRSSPRKTPQKYEPYNSPTKTKGVRLLFGL